MTVVVSAIFAGVVLALLVVAGPVAALLACLAVWWLAARVARRAKALENVEILSVHRRRRQKE